MIRVSISGLLYYACHHLKMHGHYAIGILHHTSGSGQSVFGYSLLGTEISMGIGVYQKYFPSKGIINNNEERNVCPVLS